MVPASMVQPTGVVLTTKVLVLALASPTLPQVTHLVSVVLVISDQVLVLATAFTGPEGREMAVFYLKP